MELHGTVLVLGRSPKIIHVIHDECQMTHKQLTILLFEGDEGHDCSVQRRVAPDPARAGGQLEKKMIHSSHMDQIWLVVSGGLKASKASRTTHRFF